MLSLAIKLQNCSVPRLQRTSARFLPFCAQRLSKASTVLLQLLYQWDGPQKIKWGTIFHRPKRSISSPRNSNKMFLVLRLRFSKHTCLHIEILFKNNIIFKDESDIFWENFPWDIYCKSQSKKWSKSPFLWGTLLFVCRVVICLHWPNTRELFFPIFRWKFTETGPFLPRFD